MYDPYNTGPISQPILSPAGGIVMPRRNPYWPRRTNPMLNPYNAQYRINSWPVTQPMMRSPFGMPGRVPMGPFGRPARGPLNGPPGSPRAVPPAGGFNRVPMGPPPGGFGAPPPGPPPMSSWPTTGGWGAYGPMRA